MGETTAIGWTDATWNPWWGCTRVSPGCDNCYAADLAKRWGYDIWDGSTGYRFFGTKHWREPLKWSGRRIFCASMADVFDPDHRLDAERRQLWELIEATPKHTWQLLTKRPEQVKRLAPHDWLYERWPAHVWLGVTAEDQPRAELRLPRLLDVPGEIPVRFVSYEPAIGPVDLREWLMFPYRLRPGWVICGGESGPDSRRREMDLGWARDMRDDCAAAGVPFYFKQVSARLPGAPGPADLDVHQVPEAVAA